MSPLNQQRERIQDDLRGLIAGDVRCDDVYLQLYASDASIYEIKPLAVVRPRSAADVSACVQYAVENGFPVHARGAGTGVAGGALGPGLVIDLSCHLRRLIRIDENSVRVQAGMAHERLNHHLAQLGRMAGSAPSTSGVATIGSMIARDAAGSRRLQYGSMRRCLRSLQIVLADGEVLEVGREPLVDGAGTSSIPRKRELVTRLAALLRTHAELIDRHQPPSRLIPCGYRLAGILGDDFIDVARLLAGSEGTLALITEATLETDRLPGHRGVILLLFDSLDKAARSVLDVLPSRPTACDLMDRRYLSLAREADPRLEHLIPPETEAVLLVEQDGDDLTELRGRMRNLVSEIWQRKRMAFGAKHAVEYDETELYWRLVNKVQPALYGIKGAKRPVPIVEDMIVSPELLPDFLVRMQNVFKRRQITASLFCHAGHGQLHVYPFLNPADPEDVRSMRLLAEDFNEEILAVHGSLGGEHGLGLSRTAFTRRQVGPLYDVFLELKRLFDPQNLFNPGKIVGDDPDAVTRHLRPSMQMAESSPESPQSATSASSAEPSLNEPPPELRNLVELQLDWNPNRVADVVSACNRCGECRTQAAWARMCPIFRCGPAEEASPRAKANLIRGVLTGKLDLGLLTSEAFKTVADLCVHCHSCRLECPAGVDIPRLMKDGKAACAAAKGLTASDWAMTRLEWLAAAAGFAAPLVNRTLSNRPTRWCLEKTLGIAQGRKLPRLASHGFLHRAAHRRLTRPARHGGPKVLYFVDLFANYFDPLLGEALVAVFEHNGFSVYVPPDQRPSGMAAISLGAVDYARRLAKHNVALLAESVRQGYQIVATEPAAALCLIHEYPQLLDDDDARLVAAHSSEACGFLWNLHATGRLQLDFQPYSATLGYHAPCLMRALRNGSPGESLLNLIPGLNVRHVESGCCGMAGTFGLQQKNYRVSLRAGWKLIAQLRNPAIQSGVTECSACKIQMEQGVDKPTLHPIQLLAQAYGLTP